MDDNASYGFDDFCGGPLWNATLTWNTNHPDFTECFQKTVLVWFNCCSFWLIYMFYLIHLIRLPVNIHPTRITKLFFFKMTMLVLLVLINCIQLVRASIMYSNEAATYLADIISPVIQIITYALTAVIIIMEQSKAVVTSGVIFLFFLLSVITGIVPVHSNIFHVVQGYHVDVFDMVMHMIGFAACLCLLITFCFADHELASLNTGSNNVCPEVKSSFLSRISYWWVNRLVLDGYRNKLTEDALWLPEKSDLSLTTSRRLEEAWKKELTRCKWQTVKNCSSRPVDESGRAQSRDTDISETTPLLRSSSHQYVSPRTPDVQVIDGRKKPSFIRALFVGFGGELALGNLCKLVGDLLLFVGPLLQSQLIAFSASENVETWKGYVFAVLMFLSAALNTILLQQLYQISYRVGMKVKAAVIAVVYKKALTMSNEARRTTTVGEIVNLMSVDAERLRDVMAYLWMLWSSPFQIAIAIYLLYKVVGVAVFAGLAVMVILFPVNLVIANIQSKLETRLMTLKDGRMKVMNEILAGIKVIKLYAWELSFQDKVTSIREKELSTLKKFLYLTGIGAFSWTCAPFVVTVATFATYVLMGNALDANTAFTALTLFNILRFPMSVLPMMVSYVVTAWVSVQRINKFLLESDINTDIVKRCGFSANQANLVEIKDGSFSWSSGLDAQTTLDNINLQVESGKLVAVVGSVGAGKSSLLSCILGEMEKLRGQVTVMGSVAYLSQQAWIQNLTLRNNILFGKPFDEQRYNEVIAACSLQPDIDMLPAGDLTEIGENGINLSGGQKQRVALARAVYQDCEIYLLDDPLSAVDSHVGKHLFENVIGDCGLLKRKTRLLVTHAIHWLPKVDRIVVMQDGLITETGSYQDLLSHNKAFAQFLKTYLNEEQDDSDPETKKLHSEILVRISSLADEESAAKSNETKPRLKTPSSSESAGHQLVGRMQSRASLNVTESKVDKGGDDDAMSAVQSRDRLIEDETEEQGEVKWSVYWSYCRALGKAMFMLLVAAFAMFQASSMASSVWLTKWTDDTVLNNASLFNSSLYATTRDVYLGVYGAFGVLQALFVFSYSILMATRCVVASLTLHNDMLRAVLRSPLLFFDTTPIGRILNRFSRDVDTVDFTLPELMESWMLSAFDVLGTVIILCYSIPIFITVAVPLAVIYYFTQKFYVPTSRQLRRLESKTRSPIYARFSETLSGTSTIRAFSAQERFIEQNYSAVDHNLVFFYAGVLANRWLAFRLELVGAIVVFATALFVVIGRGTVSASLVGLSISYALQVTESLNWLVRMTSDLETNMVSVERIKEYTETSSEAEWHIESSSPPSGWPVSGSITFKDYATRYRPGLDLVLKGINVDIKPKEKVGIVGRTGAGKSSLTLALFRIIESASGQIVIDDISTSMLGLHQLRSRITILPQEPVLFSGSLRMNLDPFEQYTDDQLWRSLDQAHLKSFVTTLPGGLNYECSEGGHNLSVGQRQLVCLARALLRKTCILVLDEATAAVDMETDELIQTTIRAEFADCTVLTIAHRLNTILDCDRILVLDAGQVVECRAPDALLSDSTSYFHRMAKDAGLVTSSQAANHD